jgi:hypothetical protein
MDAPQKAASSFFVTGLMFSSPVWFFVFDQARYLTPHFYPFSGNLYSYILRFRYLRKKSVLFPLVTTP